MSHNVRKHLHLGNDAYDEAIRRFIPGYEAMLAAAAEAVAAVEPELVQDLGAGTGALSEALLQRHGIGTVELIDVDPEMMAQAQQRLSRFGDRVRFTLRSYDEPLSLCDAFAASLSLHHIATVGAKSALFARVFGALRRGGVLVNADVNMPIDNAERDRLYRYWAKHLVDNGIAEDRAWQYFEEWSDEDTYLPMEAELAELQRIGFQAGCVWKDGPVGVLVAKKI
jgi:trans-aconitate methyltransferase